MLHILATVTFVGAGMFAIMVVVAMMLDRSSAIASALGLRGMAPQMPARASRIRVLRSPRLTPMSPVRSRAAA